MVTAACLPLPSSSWTTPPPATAADWQMESSVLASGSSLSWHAFRKHRLRLLYSGKSEWGSREVTPDKCKHQAVPANHSRWSSWCESERAAIFWARNLTSWMLRFFVCEMRRLNVITSCRLCRDWVRKTASILALDAVIVKFDFCWELRAFEKTG